MKLKNKAKTIFRFNAKTSQHSAPHLHANKKLLIDIDDVRVTLGNEKILADISLCVHAGEFVGLVGPNGAGKTTLLRVMLGLLVPSKGRAIITPDNTIGYIPQHVAFHNNHVPISVLEVVKLGANGSKLVALQALESVHMFDVAHKKFTTLSGGQQQRVLIAKALASKPTILILDEPTSGIDEGSQTEFYKILHDLQQQDIAIIMVSHDIDTVLQLVTRVIYLSHYILYDGPPQDFEVDKYMPKFYKAQHRLLHHQEPN